jgi:hypothetical protein
MDAGLDLDALRVQIDAWRRPVRPHVPLADSACRLPPAGRHRPSPRESSRIIGICRFGPS